MLNTGLTLPFGTTSVPVSPTSVTFINGVFNGTISAGALITNVRVTANDGAGHSGISNPFDTTAQQPPAITSPTSALAVDRSAVQLSDYGESERHHLRRPAAALEI